VKQVAINDQSGKDQPTRKVWFSYPSEKDFPYFPPGSGIYKLRQIFLASWFGISVCRGTASSRRCLRITPERVRALFAFQVAAMLAQVS
jgi:hypothetical protein